MRGGEASARKEGFIWLAVLLLVPSLLAYINDLHQPSVKSHELKFSGERAKEHVDYLASTIGSRHYEPERQLAVDYIVRELTGINGLEVSVFRDLTPPYDNASPDKDAGCAKDGCIVTTIMAVVSPTKESPDDKAIAFAAHFDSVPTGPGASDAAAGASILIEAARALNQKLKSNRGEKLRRKIIFVWTDLEEAGLLGAGPASEHLSKHNTTLLWNFEASGAASRKTMLVRASDPEVIALYAKYAPWPRASSMAETLFGISGGYTDLQVFTKAGIAGADLVFLERRWVYHTADDSARNVHPKALQHGGELLLSLASGIANAPTLPHFATNDKAVTEAPGDTGDPTPYPYDDTLSSQRVYADTFEWAVLDVSRTSALTFGVVVSLLCGSVLIAFRQQFSKSTVELILRYWVVLLLATGTVVLLDQLIVVLGAHVPDFHGQTVDFRGDTDARVDTRLAWHLVTTLCVFALFFAREFAERSPLLPSSWKAEEQQDTPLLQRHPSDESDSAHDLEGTVQNVHTLHDVSSLCDPLVQQWRCVLLTTALLQSLLSLVLTVALPDAAPFLSVQQLLQTSATCVLCSRWAEHKCISTQLQVYCIPLLLGLLVTWNAVWLPLLSLLSMYAPTPALSALAAVLVYALSLVPLLPLLTLLSRSTRSLSFRVFAFVFVGLTVATLLVRLTSSSTLETCCTYLPPESRMTKTEL
ncbi:MAG: hypothetical protein MHM6MM_002614 [Cercozoa sp. M6MM]